MSGDERPPSSLPGGLGAINNRRAVLVLRYRRPTVDLQPVFPNHVPGCPVSLLTLCLRAGVEDDWGVICRSCWLFVQFSRRPVQPVGLTRRTAGHLYDMKNESGRKFFWLNQQLFNCCFWERAYFQSSAFILYFTVEPV